MELNYSDIFAVFINMLQTAIPIAIFLWLTNILINFFFKLAFPKRSDQ